VVEHHADTQFMYLVGGDQDVAGGESCFVVLAARAPRPAQTDLDDVTHTGYLAQPPDGARVAVLHAMHFIAEVEMGIDVEDVELLLELEAGDDGRRDRVVASHDQRYRAAGDDICDARCRAARRNAQVTRIAGYVAAVHEVESTVCRQWSAEIEVEVVMLARECLTCGANGIGCIC
jgi:hypothetical protein